MEMAAPRARVLFFGGLPKGTTHMRFPSNILHYQEVQVHGSYASRYRDQVQALDMLARDEGGIRGVVSEVDARSTRRRRAFDRIRAGEVLKVVGRAMSRPPRSATSSTRRGHRRDVAGHAAAHRPGERLPSEPDLARALGISRPTLRDALRALEDEGLVRRVHGSGTYVTRPPAAAQQPGAQRRRHRRDRVVRPGARARGAERRRGAGARRRSPTRSVSSRPRCVVRRVRTADGRPHRRTRSTTCRPRHDGARRRVALRRLRRGVHPPRRRDAAARHRRRVPGRGPGRRRGRAAARGAAGRLRRVRRRCWRPRRSTTWPTPSTSRCTAGGRHERPGARHRRRLAGHLRAADRRAGRAARHRLRGLRRAATRGRAGPSRIPARGSARSSRTVAEATAGVDRSRIAALSFGAQLDGLVCVDEDGEPLRDAIIWMDRRGDEVCGDVAERVDAEQLYERHRLQPRRRPRGREDRLDPRARAGGVRAARRGSCCPARSWRCAPPVCTASTRRTPPARCWSTCAPATGTPAPARPSASTPRGSRRCVPRRTACSAPSRRGCARRLGLAPDVLVVCGCGDEMAATLGAGVVDPGAVCDVIGTAEPICAVTREPVFDPTRLVELHPHADPETWLLENPGFVSGGALPLVPRPPRPRGARRAPARSASTSTSC